MGIGKEFPRAYGTRGRQEEPGFFFFGSASGFPCLAQDCRKSENLDPGRPRARCSIADQISWETCLSNHGRRNPIRRFAAVSGGFETELSCWGAALTGYEVS